jgi:spore coat-associated protein N
MKVSRVHRSGRWALTAGATLIAVGILSFNAWANFTATKTKQHTIATGTMDVNLADQATAFTVDVSDMVPGDHAERFVNLHTSGTLTMQNVKLAASAGCGGCASSALDADATDGLQLQVDTCDQVWTLHAGDTATCDSGNAASVMAQGRVIFGATTLDNIDLDTTVDYLRFQWLLPNTADDSFQGLTSTIEYTFTGTQPANTYH